MRVKSSANCSIVVFIIFQCNCQLLGVFFNAFKTITEIQPLIHPTITYFASNFSVTLVEKMKCSLIEFLTSLSRPFSGEYSHTEGMCEAEEEE